jgi:hypothetical protein
MTGLFIIKLNVELNFFIRLLSINGGLKQSSQYINGLKSRPTTTTAMDQRDKPRASTLCCFCLYFFPHFEHEKTADYGPNNTKNTEKVIFSPT